MSAKDVLQTQAETFGRIEADDVATGDYYLEHREAEAAMVASCFMRHAMVVCGSCSCNDHLTWQSIT